MSDGRLQPHPPKARILTNLHKMKRIILRINYCVAGHLSVTLYK